MASSEAIVDTLDYAHVYSATVLDREHGLSLALTAIPGNAFADRTVEEVAGILGGRLLETYEGAADVVLPAVLATLVVDDSPEGAADRIGRLLETGDPLGHVESSVRSFVEHFISAPIVPTEESRLSGKTLNTIITGSFTLGAAAIWTGAGVVVGVLVTGGAIIVVGAAALAVTYAWSEYEKRKPA